MKFSDTPQVLYFVFTLQSCLNKSAFLLTQMPLPHTVTDFWRLVYDQHISTLVMMNNVTDENDEVGDKLILVAIKIFFLVLDQVRQNLAYSDKLNQ